MEYNFEIHTHLTKLVEKATDNKIEGYQLDYINPGDGNEWVGGQYRYEIMALSKSKKSLKATAIDVDTGKRKIYQRLSVKTFIDDLKWNYENNC